MTIALSTKAIDPTTFTVDDEPYELYGMMHMSATEEAEIMAAISQYQRLATRLAVVASRNRGVQYAKKMADLRIELLLRMTNLTEEIARALPMPAQLELFSTIVNQLGIEDDEEEDEDLADDSPVSQSREKTPETSKPAEEDLDDDLA